MIIEQISDLHFGALNDDEELYNELKSGFLKHCEEVKPDLIVLAGDCYDKRVLIDSQANIYLNKFIRDCVNTGATIILIEGTNSHDRHQINSFLHYTSDKFFIINTAKKLNVLGLKLLILPEEYVSGPDYYKELFEDGMKEKYDFAFGHGMWKHVSFGANNTMGEYSRKSFVFDISMVKDIIKHYVGFGHIHIHSIYKDFVVYSGSYARLNFGEEEPKGWVEYELKNNKCSVKFIENKNSQKFTTILSSSLPEDVDNLLIQLRNYSEFNDYLRITIEDGISDAKLNTITGFVTKHPNCMINRKFVKKDEEDISRISENMKERQDILNEKMKDFKDLSFIEITQKIAKRDYNEDFDEDYINKILNTQV